jgi:hypothetical protein
MRYSILISRSASSYAVVEVEADNEDEAQDKIDTVLGQSHRVTLDEIAAKGFSVGEEEFSADDESSWEVCDVNELP